MPGEWSNRTERSDLITDAQSILNLSRKHLPSLQNGSENKIPEEGELDSLIAIEKDVP